MKAEERIKEIFAQALERKWPAAREDYPADVCPGDPALRREIESLLRAHEQDGDFLGKTIHLASPDVTLERTGTMMGRYKLLEKIGEAGFGVVFTAEQVEPVQRKVALKVIKAGMDTRKVVAVSGNAKATQSTGLNFTFDEWNFRETAHGRVRQ